MAAGTLYLCGTPLGNLQDASPRLREVLAKVPVIACEDTRHARRLLSALDVPAPRLLSHRQDNEDESARGLVQLLADGSDVALVTDAGMPAVADPGVALVGRAHAAGIEVVVVPGPSAVTSAVAAAGFAASGFRFVGFLPRAGKAIVELAGSTSHEVVVAFESPGRLGGTLATLAGCQPDRRACVCRELTKLHEEVVVGPLHELAGRFGDDVRGEVVLILDALPRAQSSGQVAIDDATVRLVLDLTDAGLRLKDACRHVGAYVGVSARELYEHANRQAPGS